MHYFPVCLDINRKQCVIIGGGKVAERKVVTLLDCGGVVRVISPEITPYLHKLFKKGEIDWVERGFVAGDLAGAFLVIAATDAPEVQDLVQAEALTRGILVNVADVPEKCNFILPATVRRGNLTISVSTSGKSPALARKIRQHLEGEYGQEYALLTEILGEVRPRILAKNASQGENEMLFRGLIDDILLDWIRQEDWQRVETHFARALGEEGLLLSCLTKFKKKA